MSLTATVPTAAPSATLRTDATRLLQALRTGDPRAVAATVAPFVGDKAAVAERLALVPAREQRALAQQAAACVGAALAYAAAAADSGSGAADDARKVLALLAVAARKGHVDLLPAAERVHDALLQIEDAGVQDAAAHFLERVWRARDDVQDAISPQLTCYLMIRAVSAGVTQRDLTRVWKIRKALGLFDWSDEESIASLRDLLLRCFVSRAFLRSDVGKRLLAYFCRLDDSLLRVILRSVRAQLPLAPAQTCAAYGELAFRVWTRAEGASSELIVSELLEPLSHAVVHCAVQQTRRGVLQFMHQFHRQRAIESVLDLLIRLYEPILWRALRASNPDVRRNAVVVLCDLFPLVPPTEAECTIAESHTEVWASNVRALDAACSDDFAAVRLVALRGLGAVLNRFADLFAPREAQRFFDQLLQGCLDASTASIRAACCASLEEALENPLSHQYLKEGVLKPLAPLLHDSTASVRRAFCSLLKCLSTVREIKWFHIVPTDNVLLRLSIEQDNKVSKSLCRLLLPSLLLNDKPFDEQLSRMHVLCSRSPLGAARLFRLLPGLVGRRTSFKVAVGMLTSLARAVDSSASDDKDIESVVRAVSMLLSGLGNKGKGESDLHVTDELVQTLLARVHARAQDCVWHLASCMPAARVPLTVQRCTETLKRGASRSQLVACTQALLRWGFASTVLQRAMYALEGDATTAAAAAASAAAAAAPARGRGTGKRARAGASAPVAVLDEQRLSIDEVAQVLHVLLVSGEQFGVFTTAALRDLAVKTCAALFEAVRHNAGAMLRAQQHATVLQAFGVLWRLALQLRLAKGAGTTARNMLAAVLDWACTELVPEVELMLRDARPTHTEEPRSALLWMLQFMSLISDAAMALPSDDALDLSQAYGMLSRGCQRLDAHETREAMPFWSRMALLCANSGHAAATDVAESALELAQHAEVGEDASSATRSLSSMLQQLARLPGADAALEALASAVDAPAWLADAARGRAGPFGAHALAAAAPADEAVAAPM